ncbi:MAG: fibronectin type III domain-containing protein, partial [Oscillospiraceae bacterium]|nr:fibronectin type III domain-containing protein [Oscillospiraceae bacterium]
NGAYGDTSTTVYAIPHNATSIIPTGVKAGAGDSKVQVKWNTVYGATSYRVMVWDGTKWTGYSTTSTSYMVRNLTNGKKYAFVVKAYINGAYSDVSTTVYATPVANIVS